MAKRTKRGTARKMKAKGGKARSKVRRKKAPKRAAPRKVKTVAKKTAKKMAVKARRRGVSTRTPASRRKQSQGPAEGAVETAIIDVIEEPVPGVMTVTEFEAVSVAVPDDEEDEDQSAK